MNEYGPNQQREGQAVPKVGHLGITRRPGEDVYIIPRDGSLPIKINLGIIVKENIKKIINKNKLTIISKFILISLF